MPKKEISLLQSKIDKLKAKDFDLDAWKKYTIIILARIFGDNSQKVQQIENDPEVHITCGVDNPMEMKPYLQIQGRARFTTDEAERHALRDHPQPGHQSEKDRWTAAFRISSPARRTASACSTIFPPSRPTR